MHGASFTTDCFAKKQNAGLWPMVADPSRGAGVGRSDESSFRNDQGCFCAKFRVLWAPRGSLRVLGLIGPAAGQAVLVSDRFTATSSRRDAARHCWTASAPGVAHTLLAGPTSQPAGALNKDAQRPRPGAARQHDADQTKKRPRRQPRQQPRDEEEGGGKMMIVRMRTKMKRNMRMRRRKMTTTAMTSSSETETTRRPRRQRGERRGRR